MLYVRSGATERGGPGLRRGDGRYPPRLIVSRAMMICWIWLVPS